MWVGPLATFRKLSRVSPNERVKEPDCSFPRPGRGGGARAAGRTPSAQDHPQGRIRLHHDPNHCPLMLQWGHIYVRGQRRINQASPRTRCTLVSSNRLDVHFTLNMQWKQTPSEKAQTQKTEEAYPMACCEGWWIQGRELWSLHEQILKLSFNTGSNKDLS